MKLFTRCLAVILFVTGILSVTYAQKPAQVKIIHNAADTSLDSMDVYIDGIKQLDNFHFRKSTPFSNLPSGQQLDIGLAPYNSSNVNDTFVNFQRSFTPDTHAVIFSGVRNPSNYEDNPNGFDIEIGMYVKENIRASSHEDINHIDLAVFQGVTDLRYMDFLINRRSIYPDNLGYGHYSNFASIPLAWYLCDVTDSANSQFYHTAQWEFNSASLRGLAGLLFTSGFVDSQANNYGRAFDVMLALHDGWGTVKTLPEMKYSQIQFIHNSPDPKLDTLDIYVNGDLAVDNIGYGDATAFERMPVANEQTRIGIAPYTSNTTGNGYADTFRTFTRNFMSGNSFINVINGLVDPAKFADNPNGLERDLYLFTARGLQESNNQTRGRVIMTFMTGVPDAPYMDLVSNKSLVQGIKELSNYSYLGFMGTYMPIKPQKYKFTLYDSSRSSAPQSSEKYYAFKADLSPYKDSGIFIYTNGFMNPEDNNDGPDVRMIGALPNGDTVIFNKTYDHNDFDNPSGVKAVKNPYTNFHLSPNPAGEYTRLHYSLSEGSVVSVDVAAVSGKKLKTIELGAKKSGTYTRTIATEKLDEGVYFLNIEAGDDRYTRKLIVK